MKLERDRFLVLTMGNKARQDTLMAAAEIDGDHLVIPDDLWTRLPEPSQPKATVRPIGDCSQAKPSIPLVNAQPVEPSIRDMAANLVSALGAWARAGFPVLSAEDARARGEECAGTETRPKCTYWQPDARAGLGKCMLCGCTNAKWWLATAKCPKQKWKK